MIVGAILMVPFVIPYLNTVKSSSLESRIKIVMNTGDNVKFIDYFHFPKATLLGHRIPGNKYWIWEENTLYIAYIPLLLSVYLSAFLCLKMIKRQDRFGYHETSRSIRLS
jgi:hypothetical protein